MYTYNEEMQDIIEFLSQKGIGDREVHINHRFYKHDALCIVAEFRHPVTNIWHRYISLVYLGESTAQGEEFAMRKSRML